MDQSGGHIPFALLDGVLLNRGHRPAIGGLGKQNAGRSYLQPNSRSQLLDCLQHWWANFTQPPPSQPPVEGLTYIGAGSPKIHIISFIGHIVLHKYELEVHRGGIGEVVP